MSTGAVRMRYSLYSTVTIGLIVLILLPAILLASCGTDYPDPPDMSTSTEPDDTSPTSPPTPTLTAEDVAARIEDTLLLLGWPVPTTLRDTYLDALAEGDPDCPGDPELMISPVTAMEGCQAESGWRYSGNALYSSLGDAEVGPVSSWNLTVDIRLTDPQGDIFSAGGGVYFRMEHGTGEERRYELTLYGTWLYTGAEGWLGAGISADIIGMGGWDEDSSRHTISGGLGVGDADLFFDDFSVGGDDCEALQGTVMLHDTIGYWYEISLDCGSCGSLSFAGEPMGEICLDADLIGSLLTQAMSIP